MNGVSFSRRDQNHDNALDHGPDSLPAVDFSASSRSAARQELAAAIVEHDFQRSLGEFSLGDLFRAVVPSLTALHSSGLSMPDIIRNIPRLADELRTAFEQQKLPDHAFLSTIRNTLRHWQLERQLIDGVRDAVDEGWRALTELGLFDVRPVFIMQADPRCGFPIAQTFNVVILSRLGREVAALCNVPSREGQE